MRKSVWCLTFHGSAIRPSCLLRALLVLAILQATVWAETIEDTRRGFSLTLPDGFHIARTTAAVPRVPYVFSYGEQRDGEIGILLFVEEMGGVLPKGNLAHQPLPADFKGSLFNVPWQGLMVEALEVREQMNGVDYVTFQVQVPIKVGGIQLKLFGPLKRTPELKVILPQILEGLHGESNWSSSATKPEASGPRADLLLIAAILLVGGIVALWLVSKWTPRGTVLAISIGIHAITWIAPQPASREMLVLNGALRLLATAGVILGIVELVRKRKSDQPVTAEVVVDADNEQQVPPVT
jgi:hypothetical protein